MYADQLATLSHMQRQCLRALWRHRRVKGAARELRLSPHTVNNHLAAARRVLGVGDSLSAARLLAQAEDRLTSDIVTSDDFGMSDTVPVPELRERTGDQPVRISDAHFNTSWSGPELIGDTGQPERIDRNGLGWQQRLVGIGRRAMTLTTFVATLLLLVYLAQRLSVA